MNGSGWSKFLANSSEKEIIKAIATAILMYSWDLVVTIGEWKKLKAYSRATNPDVISFEASAFLLGNAERSMGYKATGLFPPGLGEEVDFWTGALPAEETIYFNSR